jgi:hypothetical protein
MLVLIRLKTLPENPYKSYHEYSELDEGFLTFVLTFTVELRTGSNYPKY